MHYVVFEFAKDPGITFPRFLCARGKFALILDGRVDLKVAKTKGMEQLSIHTRC